MPHLVMQEVKLKPLFFMGSSRKDLRNLPKAVRNNIGVDLYTIQHGKTPESAKPFKGLKGVMEIVERYASDTYRAVYVERSAIRYMFYTVLKRNRSVASKHRKRISILLRNGTRKPKH